MLRRLASKASRNDRLIKVLLSMSLRGVNEVNNAAIQKKYTFKIILFAIFLLGIFLRAKGFLGNSSFWHDECGLAWNIKVKSYSELFGVLNFLQVTPPFFLILSKFLSSIFGFSEFVFRLIPFVAGCSGIFVFYLLADKVLNRKFNVILAVLLFAINQNLINYSFEFKPYETDVFFTIICMLFFLNLDAARLTKRKAFIYGIALAAIPWFSFTSVFIIIAGIINIFFEALKNKKLPINIHYLLFSLFISCLLYLKFLINNYTGTQMVSDWQNYFITFDIRHFIKLVIYNFKYFFSPVQYILFIVILFFWGAKIFCKEKRKFFNLSIFTLITIIASSLLHFYPFADRLILFIFPIVLLFVVKPFDLVSFNNKLKSIIIIFFFIFILLPQVSQTKQILLAKSLNRGEYAREMMETMMKQIKPDDKIFINSPSEPEFAYYSSFYDKHNEKTQEKIKNIIKENYIKELNSLPQGNYWFYLPIDYHNIPTIPWVEEWTKGKQVIYYNKFHGQYPSLLMYVKVEHEMK